MSKTLRLADAESVRNKITSAQRKELQKMYETWADEVGQMANAYSLKSNSSAALQAANLRQLQAQLNKSAHLMDNQIYSEILKNTQNTIVGVLDAHDDWMAKYGLFPAGTPMSMTPVPVDLVNRLATGQVYEGGRNLSKSIWTANELNAKRAYQVVASGVAQNKSMEAIAKELEQFVNPSRRKNWNKTMADGTRIYKGRVDYNAQRLGRTLVQHGYQQTFKEQISYNPFIQQYNWIANGSRVCELCISREEANPWPKDKLPLDHPNGMCIMEPIIAENIGDQLIDWYNSPDGTYPEIDSFAKRFGYVAITAGSTV